MAYYIEAIRAAVESSGPLDLKPALDFLVDLARADFTAGALGVSELDDILAEYDFALAAGSGAFCQSAHNA